MHSRTQIHSEDIEYHDTGNRLTLTTASTWKNFVNATIGGVGMLIGTPALKLLNSIGKIQSRMMVATFNNNTRATILVKKTDYIASMMSYPLLFVASQNIPFSWWVDTWMFKLIKTKTTNSANTTRLNRNGQHLTVFMLKTRLTCLNKKKNRKGWENYGPTHT